MNKTEVAKLLTVASGVDNRNVSAEVVEVWFPIVGHLEYEIALEALKIHFKESTDWLLPAHVIRNARRAREARERAERLARPREPRAEITLDREKFEADTRAAAEAWRLGRNIAGAS